LTCLTSASDDATRDETFRGSSDIRDIYSVELMEVIALAVAHLEPVADAEPLHRLADPGVDHHLGDRAAKAALEHLLLDGQHGAVRLERGAKRLGIDGLDTEHVDGSGVDATRPKLVGGPHGLVRHVSARQDRDVPSGDELDQAALE